MARLYAATGDAIARLDERRGRLARRAISLTGSGAQCLALDPSDPDVVYAGLREDGVRRTIDGGAVLDRLRASRAGRLLRSPSARPTAPSTQAPSRARSTGATIAARPGVELTGLLELPSRPTWSFPPRPVDVARALDRAEPARRRTLLLVGIELGGLMRSTDRGETWHDHRPGAQRGRPLARVASARAWAGVRGGRRRCGLERGRRRLAGTRRTKAATGTTRGRSRSIPDDPELWFVSASTGPYAAHGGRDPQALIYGAA